MENRPVPLYTKTGDDGDTALFDGTRVSKADVRVEAYGDVDELGAWLGLARVKLEAGDMSDMIGRIQQDLFALGALLADPAHKIASRVQKATLGDDDVRRLEEWIDALQSEVPPLRKFVLAGGSEAAALLHLARAVCRRAERRIVALGATADRPVTVVYVNRLSDLLFVMGRAVNLRLGAPEIEW